MTIPEALPFVQKLYSRHGAGCCLHVVLDDGNVKDDDVKFCIEEAQTKGHQDCLELAKILLEMSKTQRKKLGSVKR